METKKLEFGTAGIRGIMKAGTGGINKENVMKVASGYADYLNLFASKQKILIGHDTRHNSYEFAKCFSKILSTKGIDAFLFDNNHIAPTPMVSWGIRKEKMTGGVMITASHNPKDYNGIKIYDETGKQLLPAASLKLGDLIAKTTTPSEIKDNTKYLTDDIIHEYIRDVKTIETSNKDKKIRITYSPVQGTGILFGREFFKQIGYETFFVEEQMLEDPDFKNSKSLNPEEPEAYTPLIKTAKENKCDVGFICDPDADRVGVIIKDHSGEYKILNGNEIAALYIDYIAQKRKHNNAYVATTVPSGHLAQLIAKKHNINVYVTHVGFKNVASVIEKHANENMIIGYEESYGSVIDSNLTRDKDSYQAIIAYAEMINNYYDQNINLLDKLEDLFKEYGYVVNETISLWIDDDAQEALFSKILNARQINNFNIKKVEDYRNGFNGLAPQKLLKIIFDNNSWFAIRPSGTEPKVKVYIEGNGSTKLLANTFINGIKEFIK